MKFLVFKFLVIFFYLISINYSYSIDELNIKNIVINKNPKTYKNVTFKDINDNSVNIENFRNNILILNFWATWCAPCIEEMPSLDALQSDHRIKNLKIFPINIGQEDISKSKIFFKELDINNLEIFFDPSVNLAKKFSLRGIPTSIFLDKEGKEFARAIGYINFNDDKVINWLKTFD